MAAIERGWCSNHVHEHYGTSPDSSTGPYARQLDPKAMNTCIADPIVHYAAGTSIGRARVIFSTIIDYSFATYKVIIFSPKVC